MPNIPYFSLGKHSFEKNAGYKSTVHALAELIDNSVEADASHIAVILMVDRDHRLMKIAVADDGNGMASDVLQRAICEKSGTHLDRQSGSSTGRKKFGKYGVGLPKASISQCNKFSVWSWTKSGSRYASRCGIDIEDEAWIAAGAQIGDPTSEAAPIEWIDAAGIGQPKSGTLVLWERLEGLTWARARWGENSGLIPHLEFSVGRVYRYFLQGDKPELEIKVHVINEAFREVEPPVTIRANDPLYITAGCKVPRLPIGDGGVWPIRDPLFDETTGPHNELVVAVPGDSSGKTVRITWRRSAAFKETFARYNGGPAGALPHGKHAKHNVGISLLREKREVDMSQALSNPSEPRERWFGVEINFPQELDSVLGMTNNKQTYTRLEQVLKNGFSDYQAVDESVQQCIERIRREDPQLAVCLEIAWKINELWVETKKSHLNMREEVVGRTTESTARDGTDGTPAEAAEAVASSADQKDGSAPETKTADERAELRAKFVRELVKKHVPEVEAEQIATRMVDRGLTYAIVNSGGLGSPFFNIGAVVDAKLIELNEDHAVYPYLLSTIEDYSLADADALRERLRRAQIALFLMLEAWAKVETDVRSKNAAEHRQIQRHREDWGRSLGQFIQQLEERESTPV